MRRTQCAYLEEIKIWRLSPIGLECFGPVAHVLMTGMATKLRTLACVNFGPEGLQELAQILDAGVLPSLAAVEVCDPHFSMLNLTAICDPRLISFITVLSVRSHLPSFSQAVNSLFQAILDGSFPKLRTLAIESEMHLSTIITMLEDGGIREAQTLRELWLTKFIVPRTVHTLGQLLPAATIQIIDHPSF